MYQDFTAASVITLCCSIYHRLLTCSTCWKGQVSAVITKIKWSNSRMTISWTGNALMFIIGCQPNMYTSDIYKMSCYCVELMVLNCTTTVWLMALSDCIVCLACYKDPNTHEVIRTKCHRKQRLFISRKYRGSYGITAPKYFYHIINRNANALTFSIFTYFKLQSLNNYENKMIQIRDYLITFCFTMRLYALWANDRPLVNKKD